MHTLAHIVVGGCRSSLKRLSDRSVDCCITSPPYYGLRNYGEDAQIGLEETPESYIAQLVEVFDEVHRVLSDNGTLWLNLGDSYWSGKGAPGGFDPKQPARRGFTSAKNGPPPAGSGIKPKDLIGIPWMVAFALRERGWYLRSEIIWAKPNGMPGSQVDRCTSSHEAIFMFSKSRKYWSDFDAIKTPPRESTRVRVAQDVQCQAGSHRARVC